MSRSGERAAVPAGEAPARRPPGRPRSFDTEEVLARMRQVFMTKGYSATSLDDLAAATGLNRPSLYAAFGNKEQLYIHVLRHYGTQTGAALRAILEGKGSIEKRLATVFKAAVDLYCAPPRSGGCLIVGTAAAESPMYPAIAAVAAELLEATEQAFERAFARAVAEGELGREPKPAARARLASSIIHTLAVRARIGADAPELKGFAQATVPVICR
jgi:AcrR family transcriptional regulator